jgi:Tfp pilus assembly protein FimV
MIRLFSQYSYRLRVAAGLCALTLSAATSMAAAPPAAESTLPAASTYSTKAGDTVERVLKNAMPDSPLNTALLRKALADANPNVVTGKVGQRFKAGTTITLPEHAALVRNTLEVYAAPGSEGTYRSGNSASDPSSRRHWIRYP